MTKPNKQRAGLQKKVSSVFKGVSIPGGKRPGEHSHMYAPDPNAVSPNTMPDDSRTLPVSEDEKVPQPELSANETSRQSTAAPAPSISTDVKVSQSPAVEKPSPSAKSQSITVPEITTAYSPTPSAEPKTVQSPLPEKSDPVERTADDETAKRVSASGTPVPAVRRSQRSSLMKRLAQSEEPEDTVVCSPSISAKPRSVRSPAAEQPDPVSKSPRAATAKSIADPAPPASTNRQASQSRKLRNARQPQAPAGATARTRHPLADSFADSDDEGGFLQQIKDKLLPAGEDGRSSKDRVMVLLIPILAIVMIFMFRQVLHKSPGKAKGAGEKDKAALVEAAPSEEIIWNIPEPLPVVDRNPLKLPEPEEPENPDKSEAANARQGTTAGNTQTTSLQIRDIVYSEDKATALVGNQIVRAGSRIDDVTIVKINRDSVELERNGETWVQKVRD
jgi:hypothetical protein